MQKARRHTIKMLRPLVGVRFQELFHSAACGAFHLSFTVLYAIGHWVVFRVGGWSPRIPTRFHVSGRTLDPAQLSSLSSTWFSHSLTGLPMPFD